MSHWFKLQKSWNLTKNSRESDKLSRLFFYTIYLVVRKHSHKNIVFWLLSDGLIVVSFLSYIWVLLFRLSLICLIYKSVHICIRTTTKIMKRTGCVKPVFQFDWSLIFKYIYKVFKADQLWKNIGCKALQIIFFTFLYCLR